MREYHEALAASQLVEDTSYDYSSHTREIDGGGVFYGAKGGVGNACADPRAKKVYLDEEIVEMDRNLESIALTADCMDDDVAQALFGDFEEGDFEEILDDFCVTAAKTPEVSDEESVEEEKGGFDFDEHIKRLMEKAEKREKEVTPVNEKDDFFRGKKSLSKKSKGGQGQVQASLEESSPKPEDKLVLEQKFAETLLEYDSDCVGDLEEEQEEIHGFRPLEGDALLEAALDEYLEDEKKEFFMHNTNKINGYKALVGTELVLPGKLKDMTINDGKEEEKALPVEEVLKEADRILANPEMEPPEEDVLIDGKSYFSEAVRNPWDCESILTTYSNMENNPTTIARKKNNKNKSAIPENDYDDDSDDYQHIQLSNKTGLPMGILPVTEKQPKNDDAVNLGEARNKTETKEEKKARKQALKQERQEARTNKKIMKDVFKDEFLRRQAGTVIDDVAGRPVFRYT
eukprot:CAMPEP_0172511688 /NCGR_PEP_ID=MMETSP1066-20121228/238204_1 /TAXON_ID=671091 /ORGANISM="Coscinodiscus wailesii, Strain CCMP2513" /LENGTH=458 /DNA_ID=CAMNT_0013291163 /DNA_START=230 /DNA_END=1606 /DNA_ORIENTATION=-